MTASTFIQSILNNSIDTEKVQKVENKYQAELSDIIKHILSDCDEPVFLDNGKRILSYDEIFNAEEELLVQFTEYSIIPIADCGDNDFIVYHYDNHSWSKFNIIDETVFKRNRSFEDLLN